MSCSQRAFQKPERATEEEFQQGNYVQFHIRDTSEIREGFALNIIGINDKYCDPQEKQCTCDELIEKMLASKNGHDLTNPGKKDAPMHKAMDEIHFRYNKETCQCMLRNAEKVGFKWAKMINPPQAERKCARLLQVNSNEVLTRVLCEDFFGECRANRIVLFKRLV